MTSTTRTELSSLLCFDDDYQKRDKNRLCDPLVLRRSERHQEQARRVSRVSTIEKITRGPSSLLCFDYRKHDKSRLCNPLLLRLSEGQQEQVYRVSCVSPTRNMIRAACAWTIGKTTRTGDSLLCLDYHKHDKNSLCLDYRKDNKKTVENCRPILVCRLSQKVQTADGRETTGQSLLIFPLPLDFSTVASTPPKVVPHCHFRSPFGGG